MKHKLVSLFYTSFLLILYLYNVHGVYGQEKFNLTTGIGLPELINIGMKYQVNQSQIGLSVGSFPVGSNENIISISTDYYYHFGGLSELNKVRPWYAKVGLNYLRDETETIIDKYVFLNTRIGRDFNISKKIGIQLDIGLLIELQNEQERKIPINDSWNLNLDLDFPILPSIGIGLFYRI